MISDGTQTLQLLPVAIVWFESDVISDGTQTRPFCSFFHAWFESDVISDGTQTKRALTVLLE